MNIKVYCSAAITSTAYTNLILRFSPAINILLATDCHFSTVASQCHLQLTLLLRRSKCCNKCFSQLHVIRQTAAVWPSVAYKMLIGRFVAEVSAVFSNHHTGNNWHKSKSHDTRLPNKPLLHRADPITGAKRSASAEKRVYHRLNYMYLHPISKIVASIDAAE